MPIDTSNVEQRRLLAVFQARKIPFKMDIDDTARVAHFYVRRAHLQKARTALAQEQQKGLRVTIK
jgi:hypothetical protein